MRRALDIGAIERLGERMRRSGAQEASIARKSTSEAWSVWCRSSARLTETTTSIAASGSSSRRWNRPLSYSRRLPECQGVRRRPCDQRRR